MKKQLLVTVVALCAMLVLASGKLAAEVGIKGGLSISTVNLVDAPETETKAMMGYQLGMFYNHKITDTFSIQPELYYTMKGSKGTNTYNDIEGKWRLGYLELPVLAKFKLVRGGSAVPTLLIGPYAAINLSARSVVEGYGGDDQDLDMKDEVKNLDFGLVLGLGLEIKTLKGKLLLEARCNYGLTNFADAEAVGGKPPKAYNRQFVFMLGYSF